MEKDVKTLPSTRNARRLAWSILVLYVVLMGSSLIFHSILRSPPFGVSLPLEFLEAAVVSVWAVVGVLILSRHPSHPVGWLWCALPLLIALDNIAWGYAYYGSITNPGSLPGVEIAIIYLYTLLGRQTLGPLGMILLFLLFPTGRLPSRRWSILVWISAGTVGISILVAALAPNPIGYFPFPKDILALNAAAMAILAPLRTVSSILLSLCLLVAVVSLLVRLAQAKGEERQQFKWFVYSTFFIPLGFFITTLGGYRQDTSLSGVFFFGAMLMILGIAGVSVGSAIAILRYRLWDIDLIIRRTLIFGLLTGTLILIYFSSVVLVRQILQTLTGKQSPIATVLSTLAIAALFSPLRRRIQDFIDRRFYRRKYNAEITLAKFATLARDAIDLNDLTARLLKTVQETVQPEHLSIWMKEQKGGERR